jgi:carboxyl-terminal processing protease
LERDNTNGEQEPLSDEKGEMEPKQNYLRIKKFHFAMLLFFLVFITAGITTFAFAFGNDEPAVKIIREREEFSKLYEAYDTLTNNYYTELDQTSLINGAINGMVESLDDPYSDYMSQEDAKSFHESISASFEGIGAEIQAKDGHIVIVTPLKGSPAEKAGLLPEDVILSVDGKSLQGMSTTEAVALIRGEKGTKVKLTVKRGNTDPTDVTITRDTIPIETVSGEMVEAEEGIAKVQISNFSEHTYDELVEVLQDLQGKGMKGLILDLRQNPGGLLDQAVKISSMFVPEGELLFQVEDREGNRKEYPSSGNTDSDFPLVVVIDKGSASASEILAGAVSESAGVPLVGEKTFGKGTVQRAENFKDGSNIKLTTEKWLTPKGNWVHKEGIKPDHEVAMPEYASLPFIDPEEELKVSDASEQVKAAQEMLQVLGYDPGRGDGFFDEKTSEAVENFQKDRSIEESGIISGTTTLELMTAMREKISSEDPQISKAVEVLKAKIDA